MILDGQVIASRLDIVLIVKPENPLLNNFEGHLTSEFHAGLSDWHAMADGKEGQGDAKEG